MTSAGDRGRPSFAIIPTHNRHHILANLVIEMTAQVDLVLVVDNASVPAVNAEFLAESRDGVADGRERKGRIWVAQDPEQPPNLSRLWQVGLHAAAQVATQSSAVPEALDVPEYDVAILNDDAAIYPDWFDNIVRSMRATGAAAACAFPGRTAMATNGTTLRHLYGPAFVIRGELAARPGDPLWPDERLRWWGGDTLMDLRAQVNGGVLRVPGQLVENTMANSTTVGKLAEQAGQDRETFREIMGFYGW